MTRADITYFSPEPDREGHASYTHVHEIVDGLENIGWKVKLFNPRYDTVNLPTVFNRLTKIGGAVAASLRTSPDRLYYLRWHFAGFPISLCAKIRRIPFVIEVNGTTQDLYIAWPIARRLRFLFEWLMWSQLRWADGAIAVTPGLEAMMHDRLSGRTALTVVPNGANVDRFSPESVSSATPYAERLPDRYMVFFGTMAPWQGIDTILKAIRDPRWPVDVHLVFAGDGQRRAAVEAAVTASDRVHYLGRVPYSDLPGVVARALGSFVCMEDVDGRAGTGLAPLKLFESLAAGVPVIVTELPFQADVVRNGKCGIVIQPGDAGAMAEVVGRLAADSESAAEMGRNARKTAIDGHSWAARARQTSDFLHKVLEPGGKSGYKPNKIS